MRYSGLYFVPIHGATQDGSANTLAALVNGIETHFEFATRQAPWSLSHRLLRSVPTPTDPAQPQSYQHIIHISYLGRDRTYCYIHPSTPPTPSAAIKLEPSSSINTTIKGELTNSSPYGTIISIPVSQSESHLSYLGSQLSPLWAFRNSLNIPPGAGITYRSGQYILNIGEVRMARQGPSSTTNPVSPGVAICITTVAGSTGQEVGDVDSGYALIDGSPTNEGAIDIEELEGEIRSVWNAIKTGIDFGKAEVKEVFIGKDGLKEGAGKEAVVRMWCDVLKLRG